MNEESHKGNVKKALDTLDSMDMQLARASNGRNVHQIANIRASLMYVRAILEDSRHAASVVELTETYSRFILSIESALKEGILSKKDYGLVRKAWTAVTAHGEIIIAAVKKTVRSNGS